MDGWKANDDELTNCNSSASWEKVNQDNQNDNEAWLK